MIVCLVLIFTAARSQGIQKTEFSEKDIFSNTSFHIIGISVFGLYIGMDKQAARKLLFHNENIVTEVDSNNTKSISDKDLKELRYYVYSKDNTTGEKSSSLLSIIWKNGETGISRIVLFNAMKYKAFGLTKQLFTGELLNPYSVLRKQYFTKEPTVNNGEYYNTYYFSEQVFELVEYKEKQGYTYYFALTNQK